MPFDDKARNSSGIPPGKRLYVTRDEAREAACPVDGWKQEYIHVCIECPDCGAVHPERVPLRCKRHRKKKEGVRPKAVYGGWWCKHCEATHPNFTVCPWDNTPEGEAKRSAVEREEDELYNRTFTLSGKERRAVDKEIDEAVGAIGECLAAGRRRCDRLIRLSLETCGKKTPAEWEAIYNLRVLDADGWRQDGKDYDEPIDEAEWNERMSISTVQGR